MDWIFSSKRAWDGVSKQISGRAARLIDDPLTFDSFLSEQVASVAIVTDIAQIDDELARKVTDFQRETGISIGIIPFSMEHSETFERHLTPTTGAVLEQSTSVLYSLDKGFTNDLKLLSKQNNCSSSLTTFDLNSKGIDVAQAVKLRPLTLFAAQASGRQTFIQIGCDPAACLYPDLEAKHGGHVGSISPNNSQIEHILTQSCHSPFVWPDFGANYASVPLAFIMGRTTRTFICSTRVQSMLPGLIPLYFNLARKGRTVGEIVAALNALARDLLIDNDPFILLGNPDSKIIALPCSRADGTGEDINSSRTRVFFNHARTLANIIDNLNFTMRLFHLEDEPSVKEAKRLKATIDNLGLEFQAKFPRLRGPYRFPGANQASDVASFASSLIRQGKNNPLEVIQLQMRKYWYIKHGFYYYFSNCLEELYLPDGCFLTAARCPVCQSRLFEKRFVYGGSGSPPDYKERTQEVCSRCLVTADINPLVRNSVKRCVIKTDAGIFANIEYTNTSTQTQWVFAFGKINDPNNTSEKLKTKIRTAVLGSVALSQPEMKALLVKPNDTATFTFQVTGIKSDLFYLLLEVNLFVDGCWNWFGVTWRSKGLKSWVDNELYEKTLPHIIRQS